MAENKNIDSLLISVQQDAEPIERMEVVSEETDATSLDNSEVIDRAEDVSENNESKDVNEKPVVEEKSESDTDDYGNPIAKSKMYSEEEVQKMIRERLSRGHNAQQAQPAQSEVNKAAKGFEADPESAESWEQQLEDFIDRTLTKKQTQYQRDQIEKQERIRQADFETKFNSGMARYRDFTDVVAGKPITDSMMLATRQMKDPAAFIYAASKTRPKDLERIASLTDPYHQAAEIGRLEESMKKSRVAASNSPRPLANTKGDMVEKNNTRPNIDARIHQHAKQKYIR